MSAKETYRITLFKIPDEAAMDKLLEMYKAMPQKALKDGKPYIIAVKAGKAFKDPRAQGFSVAVMTTFASEDDFVYYDTECEAHSELRAFARTVHQGNMMIYYQAAFN